MITGKYSRRAQRVSSPDWSRSSHLLADWLFTPLVLQSCADWSSERFPSLFGTMDNTVIRTVESRSLIIFHASVSAFYSKEHVSAITATSRTNNTPTRRSEPVSYVLEELLSNDTGPGIDGQFHLADLLVDLLHEVDDKVHQLVLVHLLRVEVGDQEANIISLKSQRQRGIEKEVSQRSNIACALLIVGMYVVKTEVFCLFNF